MEIVTFNIFLIIKYARRLIEARNCCKKQVSCADVVVLKRKGANTPTPQGYKWDSTGNFFSQETKEKKKSRKLNP